MLQISSSQRRYLRGLAHSLDPVVMIGQQGLTPSVIRETKLSLEHHELIKIRVLGDDRELREQWINQLCEELEAAPVQHLGKLLVLYKPAEKPVIKLPKA